MTSLRQQRRVRLDYETLRNDVARALPGVAPASTKEILEREAERPLRGSNAELSHASLFGDGHKQKELF